jgi:hypothetical protein
MVASAGVGCGAVLESTGWMERVRGSSEAWPLAMGKEATGDMDAALLKCLGKQGAECQ